MKKAFLILVIWLGTISFALASQVILKSGQKLEGKIIEQTGQYIKFDSGVGLTVTYYNDEIDSIDGRKVEVQSVKQEAAVVKTKKSNFSTAPVQVSAAAIAQPRAEAAAQAIEQVTATVQKDEPVVSQTPPQQQVPVSNSFKVSSQSRRQHSLGFLPVLGIGMMSFILFFILLLYFLFCFPLYKIAIKLNEGPAWLAWIPLVQFYLICKMAKRPYWVLFSYVLVYIPFINIIFLIISFGVTLYLWIGVTQACGKPAWLGILTIVPIVNIIFIWYLALSD